VKRLYPLLTGLLCLVPLLTAHSVSRGEFNLPFGVLLVLAGWGLSFLPGRGWKGVPVLAAGLLFPGILTLVFHLITLPLTFRGSYAPLLLDREMFLLLPLYYGGFLFSRLSHADPARAPVLLSLFLLVNGAVLLYAKTQTRNMTPEGTLPGALAFLLLGLAYLAASGQTLLFHRRSALRRWIGSLLLLLLFLGGGLILVRSYEEKSIAEGGGLLRNDLFQFDFSDVLQLQPEISLSDELVMLFRKEGEAERLLIGRYILDSYGEDRGFYRNNDIPDTVPSGGMVFEDPGYGGRREVFQEYYLINMNPSASLGLNYPVEITPYRKWEGSSFLRILRTRSMVDDGRWRELYGQREIVMDREERSRYTGGSGREDIAALAREITDSSPSPIAKVRAVESYLQNNYYYSLNPGISTYGDQLGYFLFVSKRGYCSYFAFAMALMLRSLDIPSRVVVGFWVDPESEVLNFYPVAANQAHAWVEVYFQDRGWLEFDPTSRRMAEGENYRFGRVDREKYGKLIEEIVRHDEDLVPEDPLPSLSRMERSVKELTSLLREERGKILLALALLYSGLVLLSRRLPCPGRNASPRDRVIGCYRRVRKELRRTGYPGRSGETPLEFSRRLGDMTPLDLDEITRLYLKGEYGYGLTGEEELLFREALAAYGRDRRKLPLRRRLLALFYPLPQGRRIL